MHFNSKIIIIVLVTISTIFADVNDQCSGRTGICLKTTTCDSVGGRIFSGKCPNDPNDVKCCDNISCTADDGRKGTCAFIGQCNGDKISGKCPGGSDFKCCVGVVDPSSSSSQSYYGPCIGGGGACINVDNTSCDTRTVSGFCPGAMNVKCCVAGTKPSWYINQGQHTETICIMNGEKHSVANAGCGVSCLSMGISVTLGNNISPETLFKEGHNNGLYYGDGFDHDTLSFLGKLHGVRLTWTSDISTVYNALQNGKGVIFHVGPESKYHFTSGGHYIFLYGAKTQNGIQKVYVYDPNGSNNYANVLFALKSGDGGIQVARKGTGSDFAIIEKA